MSAVPSNVHDSQATEAAYKAGAPGVAGHSHHTADAQKEDKAAEHVGKASLKDKVVGTVEETLGKIEKNQAKRDYGQELQQEGKAAADAKFAPGTTLVLGSGSNTLRQV